MRNITKRLIVISLFLFTFAITAICVRVSEQQSTNNYILGGAITPISKSKDKSSLDASLSRQTLSIMKERISNLNETYFRPSKLKALNNKFMKFSNFSESFKNGTVPPTLMDNPENTIINYFSVLQQAANLTTENKTGGCGTIGYEKEPYPIAYDFQSERNKKDMSYSEYLTSFEGIGHINLIKLIPITIEDIDTYKYFIELEILEGSSVGVTTFNYYAGELYLAEVKGLYYIDSLNLTPEDFFCAAYHGWVHNAELYVETVYGNWCGLIKKQYSPQQNDYKKTIIIDGVDNNKYMFEFAKLTNGTDLLINTLIKNDGNWIPVEIDVDQQSP